METSGPGLFEFMIPWATMCGVWYCAYALIKIHNLIKKHLSE